ncbi:MAG TPA: AarF/UbiB family protein [Bacilli bacterium]|nr:AarF/UbiB family protein [Bacilli bacterium]
MGDNRWYRIFTVVGLAVRIFGRIFWAQKVRRSEAYRERVWRSVAIQFRDKMYELEGLLIKVGQLLSVRGDLLPSAFIEEMKQLVDQVPPAPWAEVEAQLAAEWGSSYRERLRSIDQTPVASASIGLVYKGVLQDGTPVAIKVRRPNIQPIISADFQALAIVMWCAKTFSPSTRRFINFPLLAKEIRQVVERELDFLNEMETAQAFQERLADSEDVCIPTPFPDFCTSQVLVMEWVETYPLLDPPFDTDRKKLAQKLLRLFLPQWFHPGTFHADPHTGNVLLNREGKIVLLDFGMVDTISKRDSDSIQALVEAILLKDRKKMVQGFSRLGFLLPSADLQEIEQLLGQAMTLDLNQVKEMDMLEMKLKINELVSSLPIQVPTRFIFLGRSVATVQGILQALCPEEDLMEIGKPVFLDFIKEQGNSRWKLLWQWLSALPLVKAVREIPELLQEPKRLREWKAEEQKRGFVFARYETAKRYAFVLLVLSLGFACTGMLMHDDRVFRVAVVSGALTALAYVWNSLLQRKWMNKL